MTLRSLASAPRLLLPALAVMLLFSGICGLVYQVLWLRPLALSSVSRTAVVLCLLVAPAAASDTEWDEDEWMAIIRQVFRDGEPRDRETAIRELAGELGYRRIGSRIGEDLDNAIRTAVRRGILVNSGDALSLHARSIDDYERGFLKDQFLASLQGRAWTDRGEAVRTRGGAEAVRRRCGASRAGAFRGRLRPCNRLTPPGRLVCAGVFHGVG